MMAQGWETGILEACQVTHRHREIWQGLIAEMLQPKILIQEPPCESTGSTVEGRGVGWQAWTEQAEALSFAFNIRLMTPLCASFLYLHAQPWEHGVHAHGSWGKKQFCKRQLTCALEGGAFTKTRYSFVRSDVGWITRCAQWPAQQ